MATLTDAQLADLREKALAATRNPAALDVVRAINPKVADWLAAADPQTVLALIERIGDLEAETALDAERFRVLQQQPFIHWDPQRKLWQTYHAAAPTLLECADREFEAEKIINGENTTPPEVSPCESQHPQAAPDAPSSA